MNVIYVTIINKSYNQQKKKYAQPFNPIFHVIDRKILLNIS